MKKKVFAWFISLSVLLTSLAPNFTHALPAEAASAETGAAAQYTGDIRSEEEKEPTAVIICEDEAVGEVILPKDAKKTVRVNCELSGKELHYQWQILADILTNQWAGILGETEESMEISYALVSSVMDTSGSAYIRCAVTDAGNTVYTEPVSVTVTKPEKLPAETGKPGAPGQAAPPMKAPGADEPGNPDDHPEYVHVTVNYLDALTGEAITEVGYSSRLKWGDPFAERISTYLWLGFIAYYYPSDLDISPDELRNDSFADPEAAGTKAVEAPVLDFADILGEQAQSLKEDVTINVYYWAAEVPYKVGYWFQNINDDEYVENVDLRYESVAKTGTIIEDKEIEDHAGNTDGFTLLYHHPEAVAADGSTVFECYYDRNYYLLKFDMAGGYGVEPIYARYGTPFIVNNPIRSGYRFAGWDLLEETTDAEGNISYVGDGIANEMPKNIQNSNQHYRALWEKQETVYTVVYWRENADDNGYSYWGYQRYPVTSESEVEVDTDLSDAIGVDQSITKFFTLNRAKTDKKVIVEGDGSTIANVYYDRNEYTVIFYETASGSNDDLCGLEEHTHNEQCYHMICGLEEHEHTDACLPENPDEEHDHVKSNCGVQCQHQHGTECYTSNNLTKATNNNTGYQNYINTVSNPVSGNVYKYRYRNGLITTYYNYFYLDGTWYYLGTNGNYNGIQNPPNIQNPNLNNGITNAKANAEYCQHIHTDECYTCGKKAHIHTDACYVCGKKAHTHEDYVDEEHPGCYALYCCGKEEHVHGDGCNLICGQEEHQHSEKCCTVPVHQHSEQCGLSCIHDGQHLQELLCYGVMPGQEPQRASEAGQKDNNVNTALTNLQKVINNTGADGTVYRYALTVNRQIHYYNFFYLQTTWYYLGESNTTSNYVSTCGIAVNGITNPRSDNYTSVKAAENCLHEHVDECYQCGQKAHRHGDGKCQYCAQPEHQHTAGCYSCKKEEHQHSSHCKKPQHKHGNNCKKNAAGTSVNNAHVLWTIRAKYGADISEQWPTADIIKLSDGKHLLEWTVHKGFTNNQASKMMTMTSTLCNEENNRVNTAVALSINTEKTWELNYWFESFDQSGPETERHRQRNGKWYDVDETYGQILYNNATSWGSKDITGFTPLTNQDITNTGTKGTANLFYDRKKCTLTYLSDGYKEPVREYKGTLLYGQPLSDPQFNFDCPYPPGLEPYAYEFGGWYLSPDCVEGSEFDFTSEKMPSTLMLYAKWTPVKHEVRFFFEYDRMLEYEESVREGNPNESLVFGKAQSVPHGNVVYNVEEPKWDDKENNPTWDPEAGVDPYVFGGWFYMKNGVKTAFTPLDSPIVRDMNVFAGWGSHFAMPYRISYKTYGENENPVADDVFQYAYQGTTKTFTPKAGNPYGELYEEYNEHWFPTVASHSMTIQKEDDMAEAKNNAYTFYYVTAVKVPYVVRYVDSKTGQEVHKEYPEEDNQKAIVTERFAVVAGMVPDAFYKKLRLSIPVGEDGKPKVDKDGNVSLEDSIAAGNVITFYYTENKDAAPYAIHHMVQKPGTGVGGIPKAYEEKEVEEGIGAIDETIKAVPRYKKGYDLASQADLYKDGPETSEKIDKIADDSGEHFEFQVTDKGAVLYLYYDLKNVGYTVRYRRQGAPETEKDLADPTTGSAQYMSEVQEKAKDISGYTVLGSAEKALKITEDAAKNVIIFYYIDEQYAVNYIVAHAVGGTVSPTSEQVTKEQDFEFRGSAAMPRKGYRFDGWYFDEACTQSVKEKYPSWITTENGENQELTDNKITPDLESDTGKVLRPVTAVNRFYAKFTPMTGELTIKRENAADEGNGDQIFVYKVTNKDDESQWFFVVLTKEDGYEKTIHNLLCGEYEIEQRKEWSWRYDDPVQNVTVIEKNEETGVRPTQAEVTFDKSPVKKQWLNGNSARKVNRKGMEPKQ